MTSSDSGPRHVARFLRLISCEYSGSSRCESHALWLVAVGTRRTDAQRSCGRHLNSTCLAMEGAEGRSLVTLTITAIKERS